MSENQTKDVELEFPHRFVNDDKKEIVAIDAVQAAAFQKAGFKAAGAYAKKGQ